MRSPHWPRLGYRREVLILLPLAMLLLVVLSSFTLFAYRSAIQLLIEDRQAEATQLARRVAASIPPTRLPDQLELRRMAPFARRIALVDEHGQPLAAFGAFDDLDLLAPLAGREPARTTAVGPDATVPDAVAGFARTPGHFRAYLLRADLNATQLAQQRRTLSILTWVVLSTNVGLTLLVVLFRRYLLQPYEALLERVQQVDDGSHDEDEVSHLIHTVERALKALTTPSEKAEDDDIEALQRALGPSLESGLMLLDREGKLLTINRVGANLLELPAPKPQMSLADYLSSRPRLLDLLTRAVRESLGAQRQVIQIDTSAGVRTLGLTVHALRRDDGTVRGHLMLFVDLTESQRREVEEKLAISLAQLGELAAGVAHELRNSLATLRGYLTLIEREPEEESITDYLSEIRRESEHLQRVLEDFLSFAQPKSTRIEEVDLLEILHRAASDPSLAGMEVRIRADEGLETRIKGDAQLLERAVRNLLHNAAQAEREIDRHGPLDADVREGENEIELVIRDRGPGLSEEIRGRLFQPFTTTRPNGVGLGLSLTLRIVSLHGGRVGLENHPGGGVQATIAFPQEPG
jgi:signal transduction histidine kinase